MNSFIPLLGMAVLLGVAVLMSEKRGAINLRTVLGAFGLQFVLGFIVLYSDFGKRALISISAVVSKVIAYAQDGIEFLFGSIGQFQLGFIFAFHVLPVIVFFASLVAVLYHIGVMGWIIRIIGGFLQKILGTSRPESLSAAANIFVGQTEAPLVVRPFIASMTRSELFAVMVGGVSTVAGSVLAGYVQLGVELKYLIAASFMAAPGGFLMAKLLLPETDDTRNDLTELDPEVDTPVNVIDAAAQGAASGLRLALNVGAMLLAFVALIAMLNGMLGAIGGWIGYPQLSLELILGYVFQPIAWLLGIDWAEARTAGSFIGQKVIFNEFIAYANFVEIQDSLSEHSRAVITFALCGFANLSSMAILLGGIGGMAPNRRHDIAHLGLKAVFAGTMANLMSAAIASFFLSLQ